MTAVQAATAYLGSHDGSPFLRWLGLPPGSAWCLAFALFCQHAAYSTNHYPRIARCSLFWERAQQDPRLLTFTPQDVAWGTQRPMLGDIAIFSHNTSVQNWSGHAATVITDLGHGQIKTIEGNTSGDDKGDQRNGNTVAIKVRHAGVRSFLLEGFVRDRSIR